MRRIDLSRAGDLRARRWDAVVLGGALPGLVVAARLGQQGYRVLVVEEEAAARLPAPLREPFWLGPAGPEGVLDRCLALLGIGLRDRRRLEPDATSYQVALPNARIDVGDPVRTQAELVCWGLAEPEAAREWVVELAGAAQAVLAELLEAPVVRRGGLRNLARGRSSAPDERLQHLAPKLEGSEAPLARFFQAQIRALSHQAGGDVPLEARVRLLGGALLGGGSFRNPEITLRRLLRRRIEGLHGELRTTRSFELVTVDPHPGLALPLTREIRLGRVLVVNAAPGLVAAALREAGHPVPSFLDAPPPPRRRVSVDLRADPEVIPEAMGRRVVHALPADGGVRVVRIERWAGAAAHDPVQLVVHADVDPGQDPAQARQQATDAVRSLVPFSEGRIAEREHAWPTWDDDGTVADPGPKGAWPPEVDIRAGTRRPIFVLDRSVTAALGTEGDLLLGWRAGDTIAQELG